ncbi:MAG: SDR family oxidoreductase [Gammaproteobacteria bacterium]|nr:SDR family oxidoreductase [Gammaproteobacteria bacterium]
MMQIKDKVAIVTGAASGIGRAVALELARRGARGIAMVDLSEQADVAAAQVNNEVDQNVAAAFRGDVTEASFRGHVYDEMSRNFGIVQICVPAAGVTLDALAVKVNKETAKADIYPVEHFRHVLEINLIAPVYWAMEMVARIAEDRARRGLNRWRADENVQGTVIFIGSVSSQGNKGQIAYASTKSGLEGAAATLTKESIFHGVRCGVIHPGFTNTPMVRALGEDYIDRNILPATQLGRLIYPEEIADAICFMISNSAISGTLWADAGWHPLPA